MRFLLDLRILQYVFVSDLEKKLKGYLHWNTFDSLLDFCLVLRVVGLLFLPWKLEIACIWQMIYFLCYM